MTTENLYTDHYKSENVQRANIYLQYLDQCDEFLIHHNIDQTELVCLHGIKSYFSEMITYLNYKIQQANNVLDMNNALAISAKKKVMATVKR